MLLGKEVEGQQVRIEGVFVRLTYFSINFIKSPLLIKHDERV